MSRPSDAELTDLKFKFWTIDQNSDCKLTFSEIRDFLRKGNPSFTEDELRALYKEIDTDHTGSVEFDEFVNYLFPDKKGAKQVRNSSRSVQLAPVGAWSDSAAGGRAHARTRDEKVGSGQVRFSDEDPTSFRTPIREEPVAAHSGGASEHVCDWCKKPLCQEIIIGRRSGSVLKKLVADAHISLRLPGVSETVTLHSSTGCHSEYIQACAFRCGQCSRPVTDTDEVVLVESLRMGERTYLHSDCASRYKEDEAPPPAGVPRAFAGPAYRSRPPATGSARCFQCGKPFEHEQVRVPPVGSGMMTTTARITDARTTLQLPGLPDTVTLHADGPCAERYVEANALRCHQCRRPIKDRLTSVQLPWSQVSATLHRECEDGYAEDNATRCSSCREPIRDEGVRVRSRNCEYFLHKRCESGFRA